MNNGQTDMALFEFGGLQVNEAVSKVFGEKPITNSKGRNIGTRIALRKRSDIKAQFPNLDAEQLEEEMLKVQDELLRQAKAHIAGLGETWTLHKLDSKVVGKGVKQVTLVIQDIKRAKVITAAQLAKSWGITLEAAEELIKQNCKIASPVIDVAPPRHEAAQIGSTVPDETNAVDQAPADTATATTEPQLTQEEADALALAKMEQEENERLAAEQTVNA